jgi:hypothetical protein
MSDSTDWNSHAMPAAQFTSDKNIVNVSAGIFRLATGLTRITGTSTNSPDRACAGRIARQKPLAIAIEFQPGLLVLTRLSTGAPTMSAKITLAVFAVLLTAVSVNGTASAKSKIPSDAYASASRRTDMPVSRSANDAVFGGKVLGADPDVNVRFETLRDRDRGQY